jgi:hypothetical protein
VQCDLGYFDAASADLLQYLGREVQTGGGRGDRSGHPWWLLRVDGLVAVPVPCLIAAIDIGRERDMPDALNLSEEIGDWGESDAALSKGAAGYDFRFHLRLVFFS